MENEIFNIKLDDVIPNRFQPREVFDEEELEKLADSIKQHGVIEPIIVRPVANKFEIIAGERRYKASVLAGLTKIPAIVKQLDDKESSIIAFIENEHRTGVSAIEEARTIERILKSNNMTQEELSKELGINQSTIANKLRLLNLPMEIQDSLMHNEISERHARSLLSVKEPDKQIELLNKIKENKMTVRELEGEIKNMYNHNDLNEYLNTPMDNNYNKQFQNSVNNYQPINNMESSNQSSDFMSFLDNFDNNNSLPNNETVQRIPSNPQNNDDFMNFLNNNNSLPNNEPAQGIPSNPQNNDDFMNFLNNYDNNNPLPSNEPTNNFMLNNVNPPITNGMDPNQYVEDNPNYVDISKEARINNVDEVINRLKTVIDDIKATSNIKIDTDEINYDDLYQITIKVDKREF